MIKLSMLFCLLLFVCTSCNNQNDINSSPKINNEQRGLYLLLQEYSEEHTHASNDAVRENLKSRYIERLHEYLKDTLQGALYKFKVRIEEVKYLPWRGKMALIISSKYENVEYYMEQHFPNETSMKESGLYKFVIGLPERKDTTLSFIYLPKIELGKDFMPPSSASIEVIPVPDSIVFAYKTRNKLPENYKATFVK